MHPPSGPDWAKMIDHALVLPQLTDDEVIAGCRLARQYNVASVTVRPCDVDLAVRELQGSAVKVGSVAGFPHGSSTTAVKVYETRDALRRGAREIDLALNLARLRSRQFQYVESELLQMAETCHKEGALLKVIFDHAWLTDELKIVACRICARAEVDFASGSGPGDLRLMRAHLPDTVGLKAAEVTTLEQAGEMHAAGCTRIGTTATAAILDAWKAEIEHDAQSNVH